MKAMRASALLLSLWAGLNILVAVVVTVMTLLGRTPIVRLVGVSDQASALRPIVYAQATLANPCIIALCTMVLMIVWRGLVANARWAFWTLAATLGPLQGFAFVSDSYLGNRNLVANVLSTLLLVAGLSLADIGRRHLPDAIDAPGAP